MHGVGLDCFFRSNGPWDDNENASRCEGYIFATELGNMLLSIRDLHANPRLAPDFQKGMTRFRFRGAVGTREELVHVLLNPIDHATYPPSA